MHTHCPTAAGKTILVVDESSSFRTAVKLTLQKAGYAVVEAIDGEDAVGRLDTHPPALIVCDVDMPRMDGLSFARHVKTTDQHRFTPVIVLATESQDTRKAEGRAAGVRAWITKPFQPIQLVDAVARLCP